MYQLILSKKSFWSFLRLSFMRKVWLIVTPLLLLNIYVVNAQTEFSEINFKGGLNLASLSGLPEGAQNDGLRSGLLIGVYAKISFSDVFALNVDVNFSQRGGRFLVNRITPTSTFKLSTLDFTPSLSLQVNQIFSIDREMSITIGPSLGIPLSAQLLSDGLITNELEETVSPIWALVGGFKAFISDKVGGFIQYSYGLTQLFGENPNNNASNNILQLGVIVNFYRK